MIGTNNVTVRFGKRVLFEDVNIKFIEIPFAFFTILSIIFCA